MAAVLLHRSADYQIDSLDVLSNGRVVAGMSRTEGNEWDGMISVLCPSGSVLCSARQTAGISTCRYSISRNCVIAARDDGYISVHSGDDLSTLQRHRGHDDTVTGICVSQRNDLLFMSTGSDGMLHNWNLEFEKPISSASIGSTAINDVSISSQSEFMSATVGHDGFCRLWDSRLLDKGCVQISVLNQIGTAVSWSGRVESNCFAGLADGTICCIDWRAGGHVDKQKLHNGRINRLRMASACAPDGGSLFVTSSDDKTSKLCIERNGTALAEDECISECAALPIVRCLFQIDCHDDFVTDSMLASPVNKSFSGSDLNVSLLSCSVDHTVVMTKNN